MKKHLFGIVIVTVLFSLGAFAGSAQADITPVTGQAWSNVGWMKFDTGMNTPVTVSITTVGGLGAFGGYAWSSVGWVSFNAADVTGCPTEYNGTTALLNGCAPTIDFSTGDVTGWARVLSIAAENGDGWLQLSGLNHNTRGGGGVTLDPLTGAFSGNAYESSVMGWVNFAASIPGVCLGSCEPVPPPTLTATLSANPNYSSTGSLDDVALTAHVSGTATGDITYEFKC